MVIRRVQNIAMASCVIRSVFSSRSNISSSFRRVNHLVRLFSSRPHPDPRVFLFRPDKVEIMDDLNEKLQTAEVKYRRHPGIISLSTQKVDKDIQKAIGRVMVKSGIPLAAHKAQGVKLERHLENRKLPVEKHDMIKLRSDIERRLREKLAKKGRTPENCETAEERLKLEESIQKKSDRRLETSIYRWKQMQYNSPSKCMTYCVLRFAPEYVVLRRVFNEIAKRAPSFKPQHVFDFGSGTGTTFFASEATWSSDSDGVEEYVCVEPCEDMNDLFNSLLRNGSSENEPRHRNVTFRSFLPPSSDRQYDLVVSAYSLFELPSYEERMRTVANLWMKTNEFLVLVERGTNAGFRAVVEARDYILAGAHEIHRKELIAMAEEHKLDVAEVEEILKRKKTTEAEKFRLLRERYPEVEFPTLLPHGHVFAPCPHDMGCPRLMDVTPCNFSARYFPLRLSGGEEVLQEEVFSFIILRKGYAPAASDRWPRIVREPRKSKACIWCQTCTPHGVLEDTSFHKGPTRTERGKQFQILKRSSWGDLLPLVTSYETKTTSEAETGEEKEEDVDEDDYEDEENMELSDEALFQGPRDSHVPKDKSEE